MQIFNPTEVERAARDRGFPSLKEGAFYELSLSLKYSFRHETHDQPSYPISRFLADLATADGDCFCIFDNLKVWRSGQNQNLIEVVLADCFQGAHSRVIDGVGAYAKKREILKLCNLIHITILSGWDMYIFSRSGKKYIHLSHDSFFEFFSDCEAGNIESKFKKETGRILNL